MLQGQITQQEEYKETELGLIPKSWQVVKLEEVISPDRIRVSKNEYSEIIPIVKKIPFDTGKVIFREKRRTNTDLLLSEENKLLTSKINFHQGAVAITETEMVATTHYEFYKALENADINYLWRYFRSNYFKELFSQEIKFRGFKKEANYKFIKEFRIPLPPLREQQKIVYVLSAIQEAKEKTENVVSALKELKKSLMKHLFTYGLVSPKEAEKVKLKETEIGMIPYDWEIERLGNAIEFSRKPREFSLNSNLEIPFIPMDFIYENNQNVRSWFMKKSSEISSGTFVLKKDLIVAKITPCFENGKQAILNNLPLEYGYATTEVWAFHPKNRKVLTEYLYYYLKIDSIRIGLASKMEGTTGRKRLPRYVLENMLIPCPLVHEQEKIVSSLSNVNMRIESEENKKKALGELFKSMLHNLMTAKIRVNHIEIEDVQVRN